MKNMATMFGISMFLGAAVLPRLAGAWSWVPMKTEALKACMVEFAKENGHAAFAERIAAEKDLTSWIEETIEYAEKGQITATRVVTRCFGWSTIRLTSTAIQRTLRSRSVKRGSWRWMRRAAAPVNASLKR